MKNLVRLVFNSLLLVILLSVLYLPIGTMSLVGYSEKSVVLSAEDTRLPVQDTSNGPPGSIPKEVEDIILKLESGYEQAASSTQPND